MIQPHHENAGDKNLWERFKKSSSPCGKSPCADANDLAAYLDGRASRRLVRAIEGHLASCPPCLEALGELRSLLGEESLEVPAEVRERARGLVVAPRPARKKIIVWLPTWLDSLSPSVRSAAGWAVAAVIVVAACTAGATLGRGTFLNRRSIALSGPSEVVFDDTYYGIDRSVTRDFIQGGL